MNEGTCEEQYSVKIVRDKVSGQRISEDWTLNGVSHRIDGPAHQVFDVESSRLVVAAYYLDGRHHRLDGPAIQFFSETSGNVVEESWYVDGELHRDDDQPAVIALHEGTSQLKYVRHYVNGVEHREDGPSHTSYDKHGAVTGESWSWRGKQHRSGGLPAVQEINPANGFIVHEQYWENGHEHRLGGPAIIE